MSAPHMKQTVKKKLLRFFSLSLSLVRSPFLRRVSSFLFFPETDCVCAPKTYASSSFFPLYTGGGEGSLLLRSFRFTKIFADIIDSARI